MAQISRKLSPKVEVRRYFAEEVRRLTGPRFFPFRKSADSIALRHIVQETAKQVEKEFCKNGESLVATVFGSLQNGYADKIKSDADIFVCMTGNFTEEDLLKIHDRLKICYMENYLKKFGESFKKERGGSKEPGSADIDVSSFDNLVSAKDDPFKNLEIAKLFCQPAYGNVRNIRKIVLERLAELPDRVKRWFDIGRCWLEISKFHGKRNVERKQLSKLKTPEKELALAGSWNYAVLNELPNLSTMFELYGIKRTKA